MAGRYSARLIRLVRPNGDSYRMVRVVSPVSATALLVKTWENRRYRPGRLDAVSSPAGIDANLEKALREKREKGYAVVEDRVFDALESVVDFDAIPDLLHVPNGFVTNLGKRETTALDWFANAELTWGRRTGRLDNLGMTFVKDRRESFLAGEVEVVPAGDGAPPVERATPPDMRAVIPSWGAWA